MGPFERQVEALHETRWKTGDVIDAETASRLVTKIRGSGKNKGHGGGPGDRTKDLVFGHFPLAVFEELPDADEGNYLGFLRATTDADRVAKYARFPTVNPAYIVMTRRGTPVVSDGGHRVVAASDRGDTHVPAFMEQAVFDKYRSRIR